ncbi:zinc ribbon domain-containing protein [Actinomyces sp. W5033]|uniref:zinc ribbon domain-containing protein n=1 Tax=Actinomyces sp. W5033 TaxID=3446479 RepID=UPI003EDFE80E
MSSNHPPSPYADNGGRPRQYDVEPWRKWAYYGGGALQVLGVLAFLSVFFTIALSFGFMGHNPAMISAHVQRGFIMFPVAIVGIFMINGGKMLRDVGRKGLAGSGIILSPQGEARDAEAWNRSKGAQDQHRLEEVPALSGLGAARGDAEPQIRVRCRACGYLETEDAAFCSGCGARM